jgi:hypothetical protein
MRTRNFVATIALGVVALLVVGMGLATIPGPARASTSTATQALFGPPTQGTKVVLSETSIDGPGLWTNAVTTPKAILAWTGTDTTHRLNLLTSNDGLHYANKHTLPETSLWRPGIAFDQAGRGVPYGQIAVAWTGTDSAHTLNVAYIATPDFTVTKKFTFWGETSFTAPSVAFINDDLYLAWAGTDRAHTLNTLHISRTLEVQEKHTFWGWTTISRPDLSHDYATSQLLIAWTRSGDNAIAFAQRSDTGTWTMPTSSPLTSGSNFAPSMIGLDASAMPHHWVAWHGQGEFTLRRIFVQYTTAFPVWENSGMGSVLGEWAIAGPELGYVGVTRQVLVSWTGIDTQHHVNVAVVSVNG